MTFADWSSLSRTDPAAAAHTVLARISALPAAQRRAIFAWVPDLETLATHFALSSQSTGPLAGVPYLLKDLYPVKGVPTHAGSGFLPEVRPTPLHDSALVTALDSAGATLAGTTHLHEFAYGLTGENAHWGDVCHPEFPERTSGGSSSGSAAAVAAGIVPFAIGTDTGGSIRVPAAYCGLFGLRLTPHHAWIADAFPLAKRFDTAGWFTRTAIEMEAIVESLIGTAESVRPLRGVSLGFDTWVEADADVAIAVKAAMPRFAPEADRATREELLNAFQGATQAYAVLQSVDAFDVHRDWLDPLKSRYSPEVWQRIDRGRRWSDDQLMSAQAKLVSIHLLWARFFQTFDFLVLPATPFPALRKLECTLENRNRLLALTTPASLGGLPVLTVPIRLPSGLTTGLQIVVNNPASPAIAWALRQTRRE